MRWLGWLLVTLLAGCAKLLDFSPIPAPVEPGPTTMAAGYGHTCLIRVDHTLWCWGDNYEGQLGVGIDTPEVDTAMPIGSDEWKQVSGAVDTTCAIRSDDTLWCWGYNANGQLGDGSTTESTSPVQQPGTWGAVSAGNTHTCAIQRDGSLWCWGYNGSGELGDGTLTSSMTPVPVDPGMTWQTVTAGDRHTCAVATDGTAWCWGRNAEGECGTGDATSPVPTPTPVATEERYAVVTAAVEHSCGVTTTGHLRCWGYGDWGQLGVPADQRNAPGAVTIDDRDMAGFVGVASGGLHSCAWTSAGAGYCWGDSSRGELGVDGAYSVMPPVLIPGTWAAATVGWHHVCWGDRDAELSCVGSRGWGQLGNGPSAQIAPTIVDTNQYQNVDAGRHSTCAVAFDPSSPSNGPGSCGGDNAYGALGQGDRTSRQLLAPVLPAVRFDSFAVGSYHSCAIDKAENVYCWGLNSDGEVGIAAGMTFVLQPTVVLQGDAVRQLAVFDQSCAVGMSTGSPLRCWGGNSVGQVGDGSMTDVFVAGPTLDVGGGDNWAHVAAGIGFTCAVTSSTSGGQVWCWGRNDYGQLALGSTSATPSLTPQHTSLLAGVADKVFAGPVTGCATVNGDAWCWGYFAGDVHPAPTEIAPGLRFVKLAIGYYHVCGIVNDVAGSLYCWGTNNRGQLGTGAALGQDATSPVQIPGSWIDVAAGWFHTCAIDASGALYCWGSDEDGALLDGSAWTTELVTVDLPPL